MGAVLNLQQKAVAFTARQNNEYVNRELSDAAEEFVRAVERLRNRRTDRKKKKGGV